MAIIQKQQEASSRAEGSTISNPEHTVVGQVALAIPSDQMQVELPTLITALNVAPQGQAQYPHGADFVTLSVSTLQVSARMGDVEMLDPEESDQSSLVLAPKNIVQDAPRSFATIAAVTRSQNIRLGHILAYD